MNRKIILTLCLVAAAQCAGHHLNQTSYDLRWAYDRLCGSVEVPFFASTSSPEFLENFSASPVMWQPYTIMPRKQSTQYIGGVICDSKQSTCTVSDDTERVVWSAKENLSFTGKPSVIHTKFNFDDATSAAALQPTFKAYLATQEQSITLWPKHYGFNHLYHTYHLNIVWGVSPNSHYFNFLREAYKNDKTMKNNDVTFSFHIEAENDTDYQNAFRNFTSGQILKKSKFLMNIGDGPYVDEGKNLTYFQGDHRTDAYWTLSTGKVQIASATRTVPLGDFDQWGWGRVCFSNYWHNSVFAVQDEAEFKRIWGQVACPLGYYGSCHKAVIDFKKIPPLSVTFINTGDQDYERTKTHTGYKITIQPEDYILTTQNEKGQHIFQELLIGDLNRAVNQNACPGDSKFGIGNLFYMKNRVNFIQSATPKTMEDIGFRIAIQGMTKVEVKGHPVKNAVVWLGIIAVSLFFIAIMVCKSFSKPLEIVDIGDAPHATIGNGDSGEYGKMDNDSSV